MGGEEHETYAEEWESSEAQFELYFGVFCAHCKNEVAVYDFENKYFHLFNVIPSLIGS